MMRKIIYSKIALEKRKNIKKDIKERFGQEIADRHSQNMSKAIARLKKFPDSGISIRDVYELDCDYFMLYVDKNYVFYRILEEEIYILDIYNEKEDFMYQLFGIETTTQETLDYWKE